MNNPPERSGQKRLSAALGIAAVLSLLVLGSLSWDSYVDYRWTEEQLPMIVRMQRVGGQILHFDDVLTTSARIAAGSGNPVWEARYLQFERRLELSFQEGAPLDQNGPGAKALASARATRRAVASIEHRALDFVRQGKKLDAQGLISGAEYELLKKTFSQSALDFDRRMVFLSDSAALELQVDMHRNFLTTVIAATALVVGTFLLVWASRRWRGALVRRNHELKRTTADLLELNSQLDQKVSERTRELHNSVLASLNMMEDAVAQRGNAEQAYAELERTHKELVEASRRSGMAEVATNVLHNVGNVLNSVNVSASLVMESVRGSRPQSLTQVVALLREHESDLSQYLTDDPKGRHVPAVLDQLAREWREQQTTVVKELSSLRGNIDHIREIVAMQQGFARVAGSIEVASLADLIEDSLRMNEGALIRHQVRVTRDFEDVPSVSVQKHKVLQILVNLVRNAKNACEDLPGSEGHVTLRLAEAFGRITISVSDNGAGIAPENLTRIFAHGFTTRKDGHGFGLHSGALAAAELGGSLGVRSEGLGRGATFTLEFPRTPPGTGADIGDAHSPPAPRPRT